MLQCNAVRGGAGSESGELIENVSLAAEGAGSLTGRSFMVRAQACMSPIRMTLIGKSSGGVEMSANPRRYSIPVACFALMSLVASAKTAVAEESRYEEWQRNRPFTIGAMYYDGGYGPAAKLPAPEGAQPDMAMFRYSDCSRITH